MAAREQWNDGMTVRLPLPARRGESPRCLLTIRLSATKAVTESRMVNRRWGDSPLLAGRGRRTVVPSFHCSQVAILVALYGNASPTVADTRLLVSSSSGATSRRPRRRALISVKVVVWTLRRLRAAAGLVLRGGRVEEPLDSLHHEAALFALEIVQLIRRCLGGSDVLRRCSVHGAASPKQAGDGYAALPNRAKAAGPCRSRRAANSAIHLPLVSF